MKLVLLCLISLSTFAIPEVDHLDNFTKQVLPFWQNEVTHKYEKLTDGYGKTHTHHVAFYRNSNNATKSLIVILPGQSEAAINYSELAYDLKETGADLLVFDHLGHGQSERNSKPDRNYIKSFSHGYVQPLYQLLSRIERNYSHKYLIAHSMGGGIGARFLSLHPEFFEKAVLSAPMFLPLTDGYTPKMAHFLAAAISDIGLAKSFAFGQKPMNENASYTNNRITKSANRFETKMWQFKTYPELKSGGVTFGWVNAALSSSKILKNDADKITAPVLMLQAGEDTWVSVPRQNELCEQKIRLCEKVVYSNARHELFQAPDEIRDDILSRIKNFLSL